MSLKQFLKKTDNDLEQLRGEIKSIMDLNFSRPDPLPKNIQKAIEEIEQIRNEMLARTGIREDPIQWAQNIEGAYDGKRWKPSFEDEHGQWEGLLEEKMRRLSKIFALQPTYGMAVIYSKVVPADRVLHIDGKLYTSEPYRLFFRLFNFETAVDASCRTAIRWLHEQIDIRVSKENGWLSDDAAWRSL